MEGVAGAGAIVVGRSHDWGVLKFRFGLHLLPTVY